MGSGDPGASCSAALGGFIKKIYLKAVYAQLPLRGRAIFGAGTANSLMQCHFTILICFRIGPSPAPFLSLLFLRSLRADRRGKNGGRLRQRTVPKVLVHAVARGPDAGIAAAGGEQPRPPQRRQRRRGQGQRQQRRRQERGRRRRQNRGPLLAERAKSGLDVSVRVLLSIQRHCKDWVAAAAAAAAVAVIAAAGAC
ncbi:unnamed protein product [Phaeothamnion confervicola]